jgi:hypothetical protein
MLITFHQNHKEHGYVKQIVAMLAKSETGVKNKKVRLNGVHNMNRWDIIKRTNMKGPGIDDLH